MQSTLLIDAPHVIVAEDGTSLLTPVSRAWLQRIIGSGVPVLIFRCGTYEARICQDIGSGLHCITGDTLPGLGVMMGLLQAHSADLSDAWWLSADPASFQLAGSVGCGAGVLLGAETIPTGLGLRVVLARDFADAPRVMIPAGGGCWHDHGTSDADSR